MNQAKCRKIIKQLEKWQGLKPGSAPAPIQAWLSRLGLPKSLLRFLHADWPLTNCELGILRLDCCRAIKAEKATPSFLKHKLLLIGSFTDGDWVVLDFATAACTAKIIPHDDDWNPWDNSENDPRSLARVCSLEELLEAALDDACPDRRELTRSQSVTKRKPLSFVSFVKPAAKSCFTSVPVPAGFKVKSEPQALSRFWLAPEKKKGGMVVSAFSPKHQCVQDAKTEKMNFRPFPIDKKKWYLAMPDPRDENLDSFFAILPLKKVAIAVYGSGLRWRESDLKTFLSALEFQDK